MNITLTPLVVARGVTTRLTIAQLIPGARYRVLIRPIRQNRVRFELSLVSNREGVIGWDQAVAWSGEALCDLFAGDSTTPLTTLRLFAAPPEYLSRIPLRCDFHIHTTHSDGRNSVAEMVVRGRELGLDALAITDHNFYSGSLEAATLARNTGMGLLCLPGEEVTLEAAHILSIGARAGVGNNPPRSGYDGLRDAIDAIHKQGGRAFICHPYWMLDQGHFHLPSSDYDRLLSEGGFDGIELLGDVFLEDNLRSLLRFFELPPAQRPPVLGNSDTHRSAHTYGGYWTFVLAKEVTTSGILDAIAEGFSAACVRLTLAPPGQEVQPRLMPFGSFELADFTLFLDRTYFPAHDQLCRQEAALARRILAGENLPDSTMLELENEMKQHFKRSWFG